MIQKYREN